MGDFNEAVAIVLKHEGGFVDNPHDKGGPTNYGITQDTLSKYLKSTVTSDTMQALTETTAKAIYKQWYWDVMKLDQIKDQKLCNVMLDLGVLRGPQSVIKLLQRLLLDIDEDDGVMGPRTIDATNSSTTFKGQQVRALPLWVIQDAAEDLFMEAIRDESQAEFLPGWLSRITSLSALVAKR